MSGPSRELLLRRDKLKNKRIAALEDANRQLEIQVDSISRTYGYDHAYMASRIAELEQKLNSVGHNSLYEYKRANKAETKLDLAEERITALDIQLRDADHELENVEFENRRLLTRLRVAEGTMEDEREARNE